MLRKDLIVYILVISSAFAVISDYKGLCPTESNPLKCCSNYGFVKDVCVECQDGTYGDNCSLICQYGSYGKFCLQQCNCSISEYCDKVRGCMCKPGRTCSTNRIRSNITHGDGHLIHTTDSGISVVQALSVSCACLTMILLLSTFNQLRLILTLRSCFRQVLVMQIRNLTLQRSPPAQHSQSQTTSTTKSQPTPQQKINHPKVKLFDEINTAGTSETNMIIDNTYDNLITDDGYCRPINLPLAQASTSANTDRGISKPMQVSLSITSKGCQKSEKEEKIKIKLPEKKCCESNVSASDTNRNSTIEVDNQSCHLEDEEKPQSSSGEYTSMNAPGDVLSTCFTAGDYFEADVISDLKSDTTEANTE